MEAVIIKPCCIQIASYSNRDIMNMMDRFVSLGARSRQCLSGTNHIHTYDEEVCTSDYEYIGVDSDCEIIAANWIEDYINVGEDRTELVDNALLDKQSMLSYLDSLENPEQSKQPEQIMPKVKPFYVETNRYKVNDLLTMIACAKDAGGNPPHDLEEFTDLSEYVISQIGSDHRYLGVDRSNNLLFGRNTVVYGNGTPCLSGRSITDVKSFIEIKENENTMKGIKPFYVHVNTKKCAVSNLIKVTDIIRTAGIEVDMPSAEYITSIITNGYKYLGVDADSNLIPSNRLGVYGDYAVNLLYEAVLPFLVAQGLVEPTMGQIEKSLMDEEDVIDDTPAEKSSIDKLIAMSGDNKGNGSDFDFNFRNGRIIVTHIGIGKRYAVDSEAELNTLIQTINDLLSYDEVK